MQEIQFLEFMGGSNVLKAFPNYLICLRFIRINTVCKNLGVKEGEGVYLKGATMVNVFICVIGIDIKSSVSLC